MNAKGSITRMVGQLRSADPAERNEAANHIWKQYSGQLLDLVRLNLERRIRRREDEEDVVQSVYKSLCLRFQQGKIEVDNRHDFFNLLVAVALNKARKAARRHTRQARAVGRERPAEAGRGDDAFDALALVQGPEPTPEEAAEFGEAVRQLLDALPNPQIRQVVLWKLEGYTNKEIADKLDVVERTIERKLSLVREKWDVIAQGWAS